MMRRVISAKSYRDDDGRNSVLAPNNAIDQSAAAVTTLRLASETDICGMGGSIDEASAKGQPFRANGDAVERGPPDGALALAALGVVYGDIGTSPLYAFKQCFHAPHALAPTAENVLGVLSLIVWSLVLVVSVKYLLFILRADNRGEGGIVALVALLNPWRSPPGTRRYILMMMGLFGAALLYGDGTITPAISVLSAVEGVEVATPTLHRYVLGSRPPSSLASSRSRTGEPPELAISSDQSCFCGSSCWECSASRA